MVKLISKREPVIDKLLRIQDQQECLRAFIKCTNPQPTKSGEMKLCWDTKM